jgi:hypothetical protein
MTLPTEAKARKQVPIYSGVLKYFPDAIAEVAAVSFIGNEQHNPGTALHWDRSKSTDEHDALMRHMMEAGTIDTDGQRHSAKVAWRALAMLQKEIEAARNPNKAVMYRGEVCKPGAVVLVDADMNPIKKPDAFTARAELYDAVEGYNQPVKPGLTYPF